MDTNKIIGIALIVISLFLGYQGYEKFEKNTASLNIGKLELSAKKGSNEHWFYLGGAFVLLAGGLVLLRKK